MPKNEGRKKVANGQFGNSGHFRAPAPFFSASNLPAGFRHKMCLRTTHSGKRFTIATTFWYGLGCSRSPVLPPFSSTFFYDSFPTVLRGQISAKKALPWARHALKWTQHSTFMLFHRKNSWNVIFRRLGIRKNKIIFLSLSINKSKMEFRPKFFERR